MSQSHIRYFSLFFAGSVSPERDQGDNRDDHGHLHFPPLPGRGEMGEMVKKLNHIQVEVLLGISSSPPLISC